MNFFASVHLKPHATTKEKYASDAAMHYKEHLLDKDGVSYSVTEKAQSRHANYGNHANHAAHRRKSKDEWDAWEY